MDPVDGIPLDEFLLDERIYERSKQWASFMMQTSKRSASDDKDFSYDEIYQKSMFEEEEDESADDSDTLNLSLELTDDEVSGSYKGAFNMSVLKLRTLSESLSEKRRCSKIAKNKMKRLIPIPIKEEPDKDADEVVLIDHDVDIQNIVDQTLPLLAERERKWKESGMLNVLNTFDEKKIEEKVGTWLLNNSTHNSTYNVPLLSLPQQEQFHTQNYCAEAKYPHSNFLMNTCAPDSEEESLHSMDTARYIRSNRKPRNGTTMNIKTFRLLQSKRNALREKYSFPEVEYQSNRIAHVHRHHMLKNIPILKLYRPYDNKCEISLETSGCSQQKNRRRRKILNKRRARTLMVPSYSSTSDSYNENTSDEEEFAENKSFVANSYRQCCHRMQSSAYSFTTIQQKSSAKLKYDFDERPQKRASECCCCDEVKLCKGIRHLADTSTEEWIVENCLTPKKAIKKKILKRQNRINKEKIAQVISISKQLKEKLKTDRKKEKNIANDIDHIQGLVLEKDFIDSTEVPNFSKSKTGANEDSNKKIKNERKIHKRVLENAKSAKKQKVKPKSTHEIINEKECEEETSNTNKDLSMRTSAEIKTRNKLLKIVSGIDQVQDSVLEKHLEGSIKIQNKSCIKEIGKSEDTNKKNKKERKTHKPELKDKKKSAKKQKVNTKDIHETTDAKHDLDETQDLSFERDLKLALKISKNLYEEDTCGTKYTNADTEQKTKNRTLEIKSKTTESSSKENIDMPDQVFEDKTYFNKISNETQEQTLNETETSLGSSAEKKLKPQPKSIKQKYLQRFKEKMKLSLNGNSKDETFFALKNANICNSTANTNGGIAIAKELSSASSTRNSNCAANENSSKSKSLSCNSDNTDCAVVSSTTCDTHSIKNKGILLYTPKSHNLAPAHSISNGEFHLTEDHLSSVIGEKSACKFFKHYVGRLRFDANLSLFFRPPRNNNTDTASESDDDPLDQLGEHGELYVSFTE